MGDSKSFSKRRPRQEWRVIDVVVKENAGIEISELPLQIPRFSFRIGTAHYPDHEGDPIKISSRLTIFNIGDALDLLEKVEAKYTQIREDKIEEVEERKRRARAATPEVTRRRNQVDD